MSHDQPEELPYFAAAPRAGDRSLPPAAERHSSQPLPGYDQPQSWSPPPPPPARFSGLCAGALAAAVVSAAGTAFEGGPLGRSVLLSLFTVLLSVAALATTATEPLTNRWMGIVALVVGLAPLLPFLFVFVFFGLLL